MMKTTIFLVLCCAVTSVAAQETACLEPDFVAPIATLDFKRAYLGRDHDFIGVFELANVRHAPGFTVLMAPDTTPAFLDGSTAQVEFKDLNDNWVVLDDGRPPGTYVRTKIDPRTLKPGERLTFRYRMFPQARLKQGGTEFRLKLYTEPRTLCLVSFPFQAVPIPRPPRELRPLPPPRPRIDRNRRGSRC